MVDKPTPKSSLADKELDRVEAQFQDFDKQVKGMTQDALNAAPKIQTQPTVELSQKDIAKTNDLYIKPNRTIGSREKFNEKYRSDYEFAREYVHFSAENKEIIGEELHFWTKPFAGMPAEEWKVPVNRPVWAPRYVAERIKGCTYTRLSMKENRMVGSDGMGTYYGSMVAEEKIPRLDAHPISERKSLFMGSASF